MKIIALIFGVITIMLGSLWLLQGLGLVHVRPILCFADCAAIQGASATWAIIGGVSLGMGGLAIFWSRKASLRGRQKS
jgi:hypothetical protein